MKTKNKFLLLIGFCVLALLLSICVGSVSIPFSELLAILSGNHTTPNAATLLNVRLPRTLAAFVVGMGLSVSGAVMQSVLQNPLASSYTLGVSSGASLGAAIIIVTGFSIPFLQGYTLPLFGFAFGFVTVFLAIWVAKRIDGGMQNQTIILVGMILSLFVNGILSLISVFFRRSMEQLVLWQMGSFSSKYWDDVNVLAPIILITIILLLLFHREMDMLSFGELQARSMGVNTKQTKLILLLLSSIITGTAVCFTGVIGFVDLIAPHMMRRIFGASHKKLIPAVALFGGAFMTLCDTVARCVLDPKEIPIGAITALLGAPFFVFVYFRTKKGDSK